MFCRNCGNSLKEGTNFCPNCGSSVRDLPDKGELKSTTKGDIEVSAKNIQDPLVVKMEQQSVVNPNINQNVRNVKKNSFPKWGIALIVCCVCVILAFLGGILGLVFGFLGKYKTMEYIELGNDEIPTIYKIIGEKKVCSVNSKTSGDYSYEVLSYCEDEITTSEMNRYAEYLQTIGYLVVDSNVLGKYSVDSGYAVFIEINGSDELGYVITYSREVYQGTSDNSDDFEWYTNPSDEGQYVSIRYA